MISMKYSNMSETEIYTRKMKMYNSLNKTNKTTKKIKKTTKNNKKMSKHKNTQIKLQFESVQKNKITKKIKKILKNNKKMIKNKNTQIKLLFGSEQKLKKIKKKFKNTKIQQKNHKNMVQKKYKKMKKTQKKIKKTKKSKCKKKQIKSKNTKKYIKWYHKKNKKSKKKTVSSVCHIVLVILLLQVMLPNGWILRKAMTEKEEHSKNTNTVNAKSSMNKMSKDWSMQEQVRLELQQGVTRGMAQHGWKIDMIDMTSRKLRNRRIKAINGNRVPQVTKIKIIHWNLGAKLWVNKLDDIEALLIEQKPHLCFLI